MVSRAGIFGSGSGLKLTKISGLIRAQDVLFVLSAQKYNQNNLAIMLNFSDLTWLSGFFGHDLGFKSVFGFGLGSGLNFLVWAGFEPELVGPFTTLSQSTSEWYKRTSWSNPSFLKTALKRRWLMNRLLIKLTIFTQSDRISFRVNGKVFAAKACLCNRVSLTLTFQKVLPLNLSNGSVSRKNVMYEILNF